MDDDAIHYKFRDFANQSSSRLKNTSTPSSLTHKAQSQPAPSSLVVESKKPKKFQSRKKRDNNHRPAPGKGSPEPREKSPSSMSWSAFLPSSPRPLSSKMSKSKSSLPYTEKRKPRTCWPYSKPSAKVPFNQYFPRWHDPCTGRGEKLRRDWMDWGVRYYYQAVSNSTQPQKSSKPSWQWPKWKSLNRSPFRRKQKERREKIN